MIHIEGNVAALRMPDHSRITFDFVMHQRGTQRGVAVQPALKLIIFECRQIADLQDCLRRDGLHIIVRVRVLPISGGKHPVDNRTAAGKLYSPDHIIDFHSEVISELLGRGIKLLYEIVSGDFTEHGHG
ncbi:hypothetical protein D3C73_1382140 [compost metagenome]